MSELRPLAHRQVRYAPSERAGETEPLFVSGEVSVGTFDAKEIKNRSR
jgi:hypothetical protein